MPREHESRWVHTNRNIEPVVLPDGDCLFFVSEIIAKEIASDDFSLKDLTNTVVFENSSPVTIDADTRVLCFGRSSSSQSVNGLRICQVETGTPNVSGATPVLPLTDIYQPSISYEKDSNTLHLWFWTNGEDGDFQHLPWSHTETKDLLFKTTTDGGTGTPDSGDCATPACTDDGVSGFKPLCNDSESKAYYRTLWYTTGSMHHGEVSGSLIGGEDGIGGAPTDVTREMIPIFRKPQKMFEHCNDDNFSGMVTDGYAVVQAAGGGDSNVSLVVITEAISVSVYKCSTVSDPITLTPVLTNITLYVSGNTRGRLGVGAVLVAMGNPDGTYSASQSLIY